MADKNFVKWNTLDVPPPKDRAFLVTTAGPNMDIAFWDKGEKCFKDYFFKQRLSMKYPMIFAWAEMPEPAKYGDTAEKHKLVNDEANARILEQEMQKTLAKKCAELIQAGETMPMAVTDMTTREYGLFEIIAKMSGFIQFLSTYLDPEHRAMHIRVSGLEKDLVPLTKD